MVFIVPKLPQRHRSLLHPKASMAPPLDPPTTATKSATSPLSHRGGSRRRFALGAPGPENKAVRPTPVAVPWSLTGFLGGMANLLCTLERRAEEPRVA
jgi:hypothetical protein